MTIGETIRMFRTYEGLTQAQLAKKAGLSAVSISKIEGDDVIPSSNHMKSISKALNKPVALLLLFILEAEKIPADKKEDYSFLINRLRSFYTSTDESTVATV